MSSLRSSERFTGVIIGAAAILFAASAYNVILANVQNEPNKKSKSKSDALSSTQPEPKLSSQSAVHNVTYATKPEDCQSFSSNTKERPKLHAGALFKLIDIAAGVAARRHAGRSCVTISVDSVVLLKPIYLGDLIHVSASVNRAWGSSMEVGVRIVKESITGQGDNKMEYVSHSYLTFVAINKSKQIAESSYFGKAWQSIFGAPAKPAKPNLALIKPMTRLESRRHLLAGRRRTKRLADAQHGRTREGVSIEIKSKVRQEMQKMMDEYDQQQFNPPSRDIANAIRGDELLRAIEIEVLIQAWAQGEDVVHVHDGMVEVNMPGDEPLLFPEAEVRQKAKKLGIKLPGDARFDPTEYRLQGSATPTWAQSASPPLTPLRRKQSNLHAHKDLQSNSPFVTSQQPLPAVGSGNNSLPVISTLTTSMHIVFPQHTNSIGIIFGGNTMSWSEEVALMACRKIQVKGMMRVPHWKTVSMDGLEFNVQVGVGELMILSAIVVRTYAHSCEVYVLAQAENREGQRRFTNDVLFTMAYCKEQALATQSDTLDGEGKVGSIDDHITSQIIMPANSALESFANASQVRRQQRLELRQMLVRVYGSQGDMASASEQ
ncbi:uncharacterized protein FA14DRAFT_159092 [Meira miltonrushii]|uniref:HotDog ACOT-type domain-containing protein n=1 Tax=Meira miltonrushii TaxID=1280837 RepID=A0A316VGE9_9BASI|nr:uncharacterized protein FA14DRAFT_159092 [Meira miltonrushii]PWN36662.1 hypothetical protein FA14DRAFT_159092 [Meira miltonrushii]